MQCLFELAPAYIPMTGYKIVCTEHGGFAVQAQ